MRRSALSFSLFIAGLIPSLAQDSPRLPETNPLTLEGDLSAQMVAGIDRFLMRELAQSVTNRQKFWQRDFSSREAYEKSVAPNRDRLRRILGAVDVRMTPARLEYVSDTVTPAKIAETDSFTVFVVRWPVFEGVHGEGLLLQPKAKAVARIVAIPDADQTPEQISGLSPGLSSERQWARRLAENGCEVLVPVLINRDDTFSGNALIRRFTNQPHREWIYRQAYELGRHVIGYEVQKVLAAVDWFAEVRTQKSEVGSQKIAVAGHGEGGLIALYSAALDTRIEAALVSGYFDSREQVWQEPIYRNLFGLLREFGDAEIATLIAPRALLLEHSVVPNVDGPPKPQGGKSGAAPGKLTTPDYESVEREVERANALLKDASREFIRPSLVSGAEGMATGPCSDRALVSLLKALDVKVAELKRPGEAVADSRVDVDVGERQRRQVKELEEFTQKVFRECEVARNEFFWKKLRGHTTQDWSSVIAPFKAAFWEETIGKLPGASLPPNPRTQRIYDEPKWIGYEVVLDVFPDVFAWGYLLVPKGIKPGEQRPVVVCQHGLEGVPADTVTGDTNSQAFRYYKAFSARLAERGFVVFAPHNPYRGQDKFRLLQRKANPLKLSLFSFIIAQHDQILNWLSTLPFVDAQRIGFYGLSYGGKTAMRVPAVLDRYALSICSADFNEWVRKNVSVDFPASYMYTGEYEMPEWDLGHTFNYAEMATLICPRPFMVERGHNDGVGIDEWVAYEYAKVRRLYNQLGIGDRTEIEFFDGPHTINGVGTFEFLEQHLAERPARK
jgi:dienelactone hydrolase